MFIQDILKLYKEEDPESYSDLESFAKGYDISEPFSKVPMEVYNNMCAYVEDNLGAANLKKIGETIGETVYEALISQNLVRADPNPKEILEGLIFAAANMIQDPEKRGWEMLEAENSYIIMRRTQTFNSTLQFGLLKGLVKKTGKTSIEVILVKSVQRGDEFDEYKVTWIN